MVDFDVVDLGPTDHVALGETAPDFTRPLVADDGWHDASFADTAGSPTVLVFTTMAGAFPAEYTLTELRDRGIGVSATDADPARTEDGDEADDRATTDEEATPLDADRPTAVASSASVLAVSISSPYELAPFLRDHDLPYGVFSDPTNAVAETYGVVHDLDGMTGITEPRPAIFVLDADRTVEYAWVATEWPDFPDYDELEAVLADW
ncbi:Peroxiredoxin [Halovivax ruber XH-70]|uniref:Peroxiredoxin n=1 Tax=Halovivax ruber (strain DSM 18193 / JCM 13892 / XH-70) TaxID=797302 RepID=L0IDP6_HALRX|nr:redoxin domain-containing protein [Halovivax ruber]AGB17685.1 Peroxiredoxin [Halovivax ruber XH-70]